MNKFQEGYVVFCNSVLKEEFKSEEFDELFSLPFEIKKDGSILESKHDDSIQFRLLTTEEFQIQFLFKYQGMETLFQALDSQVREDISNCAMNFIILALKHMKLKLPFQNETLEQSQVIFLEKFDKNYWLHLKAHFPNIIKTDQMKERFVNELDNFQYNFKKIKSSLGFELSPIQIWKGLKKTYPTMYVLATALMTLPHSSVCVERIFSKLRDIKTLKRNRLSIENLEACIINFEHFETAQIHIVDQMKIDYLKSRIQKVENPQTLPLSNGDDNVMIEEKKQEDSQYSHFSRTSDDQCDEELFEYDDDLPSENFHKLKRKAIGDMTPMLKKIKLTKSL